MESPKSYSQQRRKERPKPSGRPTHKNHKFYASKAWRGLRAAYITKLTDHQHQTIPLTSTPKDKQMYLLSKVPICQTCYRLFMAGAYSTVNTGTEVDHIDPINPQNALQSQGWGNPMSEDNLQLLCKEHHQRKSQRDKRVIKNKQQ